MSAGAASPSCCSRTAPAARISGPHSPSIRSIATKVRAGMPLRQVLAAAGPRGPRPAASRFTARPGRSRTASPAWSATALPPRRLRRRRTRTTPDAEPGGGRPAQSPDASSRTDARRRRRRRSTGSSLLHGLGCGLSWSPLLDGAPCRGRPRPVIIHRIACEATRSLVNKIGGEVATSRRRGAVWGSSPGRWQLRPAVGRLRRAAGALDGSVDGGAADGEQLGELGCGVLAGAVEPDEVGFPWGLAAEPASSMASSLWPRPTAG